MLIYPATRLYSCWVKQLWPMRNAVNSRSATVIFKYSGDFSNSITYICLQSVCLRYYCFYGFKESSWPGVINYYILVSQCLSWPRVITITSQCRNEIFGRGHLGILIFFVTLFNSSYFYLNSSNGFYSFVDFCSGRWA